MPKETLPTEDYIKRKLESSGHEIVQKYTPKFVGSGDESMVYTAPEHPDVVVKVRIETIQDALEWHKEHGGTAEEYMTDTEAQSDTGNTLERERVGHEELREYYGDSHTLRTRFIRMKIPTAPLLSREDTTAVTVTSGIPHEIYVVAEIQRQVPEIISGEVLHLQSRSPKESLTTYTDEMLDGLFPDQDSHLSPERSRDTLLSGDTARLLNDLDARSAVTDFVERSIKYSQTTGRFLDVVGEENIVFVKRDTGWTYILVDALSKSLHSKREPAIFRLTKNITDYKNNPDSFNIEKLQDEFRNIIISASYVAFINNLAQSLNLPSHINIFPDHSEKDELERFTRSLIESCLPLWYQRNKPKN